MDGVEDSETIKRLIQSLNRCDASQAIGEIVTLTYLGGRHRIADNLGLPRRYFYSSISVRGKPDLQLILDTLAQVGLRLTVVPNNRPLATSQAPEAISES